MLRTSVRSRLLLLTWVVTLGALVVAVSAVALTYRRERAAVDASLRETTRALSLVIERELARREAVAWTLAASGALRRGDFAEFHAFAREATRDDGEWVVVSDAERQLVNSSVPFGTPLPGRLANEPLAVDGARVSALRTAPIIGRQVFGVLVPLRVDGRPLMNVVVVSPRERIQRVLDGQGLPASWIASVVDQEGRVVARTSEPERWAGKETSGRLREAMALQPEGFLYGSRSLDGRVTTAYFATAPGYGWRLVVAVPDGVLGGSLRRSLAEVGVAAALLLAMAGLLAWRVSRRISAPARALQDAARALRADEPVRWRTHDVPEFDAAGQALAEASAAIRASRQELEQRVAEALADADHARRQAERSQRLEALGRLTGGIAHDVNNLLAIVSNNLFLLQRLQADARTQPQLDAIRRAVESGRTLTRKLQALSPARAARPEPIDLSRWLPETLPLLRSAAAKDVSVEVAVAPGTVPVRADASELQLALINLVVNASDAMPAGGRVSIRARAADGTAPTGVPGADGAAGADGTGGGPMVALAVTDTGEGIPPEIVDRVFEPFFTTKSDGKGTGLGLAQVHALCAQLGGAASIESVPGQGTTVLLTLPAAAQAPGAVERVEPATAAASPRRGGRILYAEDNRALAESTVAALESFGYDVLHVASADEALRLAGQAPFDAVVSDVVMPGAIDGVGLAERLRVERPGLPVVLVTGYTEQMSRVVGAGFTVLQKPCGPSEIVLSIERERASRRPAAEASQA